MKDIAKLFNALPPSAEEAESALIGSILIDPRVLDDIADIISGPEDFSRQGNAAIYETCVALYEQTRHVDAVNLAQRLQDKRILEQVGGVEHIHNIVDSVPTAAGATHYAKLIRDKALQREIIAAAGETLQECHTSGANAAEMLDNAGKRFFALQETKSTNKARPFSELICEVVSGMADGTARGGVPTGLMDLDSMTHGMHGGQMIVIAARPSMGKTALAMNIAEHVAMVDKQPTAFFSLEMGYSQLIERVLCSQASVDGDRVRAGTLSSSEWERIHTAVQEIETSPLWIDDQPGLTIMQLRARARRLVREHGIKCIIIDYMQLLTDKGHNSRQEEVSSISRQIKEMAREFNIPVVALAQLNRAVEGRGEGARPRMSDLRESGSIEQDADVVMMLHREDYYKRGDPDHVDDNIAELIVAKQRNGPTGTVKLHFDNRRTRFGNLARGAQDW